MMAPIIDLPTGMILKIAYLLTFWDDMHSFLCVFRLLRKFQDYAAYARENFEEERDRGKLLEK